MSRLAEIDRTIFLESFPEGEHKDAFLARFNAADDDLQRAVVGYLNTYAGPWGLKASSEDAVFGVIKALWPDWGGLDPSGAFQAMRNDARFAEIADVVDEDCGFSDETKLCALILTRIKEIIREEPRPPEALNEYGYPYRSHPAQCEHGAYADCRFCEAAENDKHAAAHGLTDVLRAMREDDAPVTCTVHGVTQSFATIRECIDHLIDELAETARIERAS